LAKGEVELCVHPMSEILAVEGARLADPLPRELQRVTIYSTGVTTGAAAPEAAKAFVAFLTIPPALAQIVFGGRTR